MNTGELIATFRSIADDQAEPPLWEDPELYVWFSEAEIEACRRARLIVDSRSKTDPDNVCQLTLEVGEPFYELDPRVIYIRRAMLAGRNIPLTPLDYRDMDKALPGWESHSGGIIGYVRGLDSGQFRAYRIPEAVGVIDLIVAREPLHALAKPDDVPEIAARYHLALLDWVFWRCYSKKDSQAYDPNMAMKHLAIFEAEFGTRKKANAMEEEWQRNNLPFNEQDGNY